MSSSPDPVPSSVTDISNGLEETMRFLRIAGAAHDPSLARLEYMPIELLGNVQSYLWGPEVLALRLVCRTLAYKLSMYIPDRYSHINRKRVNFTDFPTPDARRDIREVWGPLTDLHWISARPYLACMFKAICFSGSIVYFFDNIVRAVEDPDLGKALVFEHLQQQEQSPETFHLLVDAFKNFKGIGKLELVDIMSGWDAVLGAMHAAGYKMAIARIWLMPDHLITQPGRSNFTTLLTTGRLARELIVRHWNDTHWLLKHRHDATANPLIDRPVEPEEYPMLRNVLACAEHVSSLQLRRINWRWEGRPGHPLAYFACDSYPSLRQLRLSRVRVSCKELDAFLWKCPNLKDLVLTDVAVKGGSWRTILHTLQGLRNLQKIRFCQLSQEREYTYDGEQQLQFRTGPSDRLYSGAQDLISELLTGFSVTRYRTQFDEGPQLWMMTVNMPATYWARDDDFLKTGIMDKLD